MLIKFRHIGENDLETIRMWRMKSEVTRYMYSDPQISASEQIEWFDRIRSDKNSRYWIINVDGQDVGLVNIVNIDMQNKRAEWAYYLAEESVRGKGIGKNVELNILDFVFNKLNLNKLCCEVLKENELFIKIHEKYGSKIEGVRRHHVYKNGEYKDIVEMGILKEDWSRIKKDLDYIKVVFDE